MTTVSENRYTIVIDSNFEVPPGPPPQFIPQHITTMDIWVIPGVYDLEQPLDAPLFHQREGALLIAQEVSERAGRQIAESLSDLIIRLGATVSVCDVMA